VILTALRQRVFALAGILIVPTLSLAIGATCTASAATATAPTAPPPPKATAPATSAKVPPTSAKVPATPAKVPPTTTPAKVPTTATPAKVPTTATATSAKVPAANAVAGAASTSQAGGYVLPGGPFAGRALYVDPTTTVARAAAAGPATADPIADGILARIAAAPQATWLVGGSPDAAASTVSRLVRAAAPAGQVTQFVVYDIPHRDCSGGQSAGGAPSGAAYQAYVSAVAQALAGAHAIVVLEPDALAGIDCLGAADQAARLALLKWATARLAAVSGVLVYLDAGHAGWQPAGTIARRLIGAGVASARGFALDVANYGPLAQQLSYGAAVSAQVGWKRFVVDTSRNGATAPLSGWCNLSGAALGVLPATPTGYAGADALLWIKHPGESDGVCGASSAPAGQFDPSLALRLARNAGW
jgi:endoglucanase